MGANLKPDVSAVEPWAVEWVKGFSAQIDERLAAGDTSEDWSVLKQQFVLLREQPDISLEQLNSIAAPVLLMAGDKDVIRGEHTLLMFQNIPKAHLAIFPGSTHYVPETQPALFNSTVEKFLSEPYARPTTQAMILGE